MNTTTLGARGFSCAVSAFSQVLKSDPLVSSAFGRRNEAPRRTREKTSVTQDRIPRVTVIIQNGYTRQF